MKNFFKHIHDSLQNSHGIQPTINISISLNSGNALIVSIIPKDVKISPLVITGTPEELDANYETLIAPVVKTNMGLLINSQEFIDSIKKQIDSKVEAATQKPVEGKGKKPAEKPATAGQLDLLAAGDTSIGKKTEKETGTAVLEEKLPEPVIGEHGFPKEWETKTDPNLNLSQEKLDDLAEKGGDDEEEW